MKRNNNGFTLIELIVVITILSILGTIAFISLQGYSKNARDSARISDISNIMSALEFFSLKSGFYPVTSSGVAITYSGAHVWTQGTIGDSVIKNIGKISKKPVDPLTGSEYTYSRLNSKREYEIGAILEGGFSGIDNSKNITVSKIYAEGTVSANAYVKGTYNGVVAKAQSGPITYVLSIPTIINGDMELTDIIEILNYNALVYNGYTNLPSSYQSTVLKMNVGFDFSPNTILIYEGDIKELNNSGALLNTFALNLKNVYSGSILENTGIYKDIVGLNLNNDVGVSKIIGSLINNNLGGKIEILVGDSCLGLSCDDFVSTWNVGIDTGVSGFNNLKLPLQSGGIYNFTVDWGDNSSDLITSWNQIEVTHNYSSSGTYIVTISGQIDGFAFNDGYIHNDNTHDGDKIIDINQWGNLLLSDGGDQFGNCGNLPGFSASDKPKFDHITNMYHFFAESPMFNGDISDWDVSNVTNMSSIFEYGNSFNQDISSWDVSNVDEMRYMFYDATTFNQDISEWDVSEITNVSHMFYHAEEFNQDLTPWNDHLQTGITTTNFDSSTYLWSSGNKPTFLP